MKKIKKIIKITESFLQKLMIEARVEAEEKGDNIYLSIDSPEAGILIGRNGETLASLQHLLRLMANKEFDDFIALSLDVAGYKDKRRKDLEASAARAAGRAIKSGRVQILEPMNSFERRIVHMILAERGDIETESVGQEPNRRVLVRVKKKQLA